MKLSLLVPIGRFSFFVHACLQNVLETCGAPEIIDFVFLTSCQITPEIETAFAEAHKNYPFRVIAAPFDAGSDHLRLLDWAIRNADLADWVVIQHCDLFWKEKNWLCRVLQEIQPELAVLCTPCPSSYFFQQTNINIVGDFFGVYNRQQLIERKLFFKWGVLGRDVPVSDKVVEAVQTGAICRKNGEKIFLGREYMDGSQAMALELAVHAPKAVKQITPLLHFLHLTAFFRIADSVRREGGVLRCNFPIAMHAYAHYSYVTSFCIERIEAESVALPWLWFEYLTRTHGFKTTKEKMNGEWLRGYSTAKEVIGWNGLGVNRIDFNGESWKTNVSLL